MPTVTIDTSAELGDPRVLLDKASTVLADATKAPREHVHITVRDGQTMTFGSKLGGVDGPHVCQVRVTVSQKLDAKVKTAIVQGVGALLAPHAPKASTQFTFEQVQDLNLAIDGMLLTELSKVLDGSAAKEAGAKKAAAQAKQTPEEKAAANEAKAAEKRLAKVIKEGGKKGVEIEGASDMGGLDFFCTTCEEPDGDLALLELSMTAMNAEPDPEAEDRKGCSGAVGKIIFSAGAKQLAMVGYVPSGAVGKTAEGVVELKEWMESVAASVQGIIVSGPTAAKSPNGGFVVSATAAADAEKGKFPLKDKDSAMAAAFAFLRAKGAFPEDTGDDDDDEICFGDDAFDNIEEM